MDAYTKEIIEEYGSFKTEEQTRQQRDFFKNKDKKYVVNEDYKSYGNFVWLLYNVSNVLDFGISPASLTRLIFISTFINYDNKLILTRETGMDKKSMQQILKISDRLFHTFYTEMIKNNIFIEKNDGIYLSGESFHKGDLKVLPKDKNKIRLYENGIREIYNAAKPTEHKMLSYLFQAIPFVNIQYNIICHNPFETNLDNIRSLTLTEYCNILGYDKNNIPQLKKSLYKVRLQGKYAFNTVENGGGYWMFINPNIYYGGNIWDKIEVLGRECSKE